MIVLLLSCTAPFIYLFWLYWDIWNFIFHYLFPDTEGYYVSYLLFFIIFDIWSDIVDIFSIKSSHDLDKILSKHNNRFSNIFISVIGYLVFIITCIGFKSYSFTLLLEFNINDILKVWKKPIYSSNFSVETFCDSSIAVTFMSNLLGRDIIIFLTRFLFVIFSPRTKELLTMLGKRTLNSITISSFNIFKISNLVVKSWSLAIQIWKFSHELLQ